MADNQVNGEEEAKKKPERKEEEEEEGSLFGYADRADALLMSVGAVGCVADGGTMPLIMLSLSRISHKLAGSIDPGTIRQEFIILIYIAFAVGLGAFCEGLCWARTAVRQTSRLRRVYLQAILRQDSDFFDSRHSGATISELASSISSDTLTIQDVIAEKVPNFVTNVASFVAFLLVALYLCWRLALIAIPILTILIAPSLLYGKMLKEIAKKMQEANSTAGGIAQQALSSVKTVFSNVGEDWTKKKYSRALDQCVLLGAKQGILKGMTIGSLGIGYSIWSLQAWYGSILVTKKEARGGDVFTAGVCTIMGGLTLANSLVNLKYFAEAKVAASSIAGLIERVPSIDQNVQGKIIADFKGQIEFKNVDFYYPSRPDCMVLKKFNLRMMPGQTLGLVGASGSGKSTIVSLIERFYDAQQGEILFDDTCIKTIKLEWLRDKIGLVSQEPTLFATSIKENILFGKEGASMEEVINAAKSANAHDFISQLPNGYDSQVGQFGTQLSGGQRQRITIARALLKDPQILLLDEATSALDSQSEKVVQDALDQASVGRTAIIVAHRLATIRNSDSIAVMQTGQVVECGTHDELIELENGQYAAMLKVQQRNSKHETIPISSEEKQFTGSQLLIPAKTMQEATDDTLSRTPLQACDSESGNSIGEYQHSAAFMWTLMKLTSPEWKLTFYGCLGAMCSGLMQPAQSYCTGSLLSIYYLANHHDIIANTKTYCLLFLANGILAFFASLTQHYNFSLVGEHLTRRAREAYLAKILSFETEWFDQEGNTAGAVCTRLSSQTNMLRSLVCDRLSLVIQVSSAFGLATVLALSLSWRLAIVMIALQPIVVASFYARQVLIKVVSRKVLKAMGKSSQLASEAVVNHKTIAAFSSQKRVMEVFNAALEDPYKQCRKSSWFSGLGLFCSQFFTATNAGLVLWYGGYLLHHHQISYKNLFSIFFILGTMGRVIAEAGSMTSDLSKGTYHVRSMFTVLKRESKMDPDDPNGLKIDQINGDIELREVEFSYPSRSHELVLKGLSLRINAGKSIALVGQSGSGKSTIIGLIERFYDARRGEVKIDGVDIKRYNVRALRSHIALVSQEPALFAGNIHDNICYGKEDATEAEVIEAATLANAHEFISCMGDGYGTNCGERGTQLSGGQKQRIALARAILKNPSILLLDEATSALDNKTEKLVQEALEKIMAGRTSIVVAHRLSTIEKSDTIAVIDKGRVAELGSHSELIAKGESGAYYSLVRLQ